MDRGSETQVQVGENQITIAGKELTEMNILHQDVSAVSNGEM